MGLLGPAKNYIKKKKKNWVVITSKRGSLYFLINKIRCRNYLKLPAGLIWFPSRQTPFINHDNISRRLRKHFSTSQLIVNFQKQNRTLICTKIWTRCLVLMDVFYCCLIFLMKYDLSKTQKIGLSTGILKIEGSITIKLTFRAVGTFQPNDQLVSDIR